MKLNFTIKIRKKIHDGDILKGIDGRIYKVWSYRGISLVTSIPPEKYLIKSVDNIYDYSKTIKNLAYISDSSEIIGHTED